MSVSPAPLRSDPKSVWVNELLEKGMSARNPYVIPCSAAVVVQFKMLWSTNTERFPLMGRRFPLLSFDSLNEESWNIFAYVNPGGARVPEFVACKPDAYWPRICPFSGRAPTRIRQHGTINNIIKVLMFMT